MKKSSKIIIGVAVFIVTMGLIVTAVVMAVLSAKKNAELYTAEYTYVDGFTTDGAYVAVQEGNYILARNGAALSDRYAYLEYKGDGKYFYRDHHGGCGFIDTDGDVIGKVKQGTVCIYAADGYTVTVDGDTVRAGGFTYDLAEEETLLTEYKLYRVLPRDTVAVEKDGSVLLRDRNGMIELGRYVQPTDAAGLLITENGLFAAETQSFIYNSYTDLRAVYMGEWALDVTLPDNRVLITSDGSVTPVEDRTFTTLTHTIKTDTATYAAAYTFLTDGTNYWGLRDGRLTDVGLPFETPKGLCFIDGRDVKDVSGKTVKSFKVDVAPVVGAYAVQYDDAGNSYGRAAGHYIEPLDGKSFACPEGTAAIVDQTGEIAYLYRDGTTVTAYDFKGKKTDGCDDREGRVTVAGGHIFITDVSGVTWRGKTTVDAFSQDGKFAFRGDAGKITVIKTDTDAETYYYTAGTPSFTVTPYGTVVTDSRTGLKGYISVDGKLAVKLTYRTLEVYNGYLTLGVDGDTKSIADYKGKSLFDGVTELRDLGMCAYIETVTGAKIVDAHGRDLVKSVTGEPQKLTQRIDWYGSTLTAVREEQCYYTVTSGKLRLLRTVL